MVLSTNLLRFRAFDKQTNEWLLVLFCVFSSPEGLRLGRWWEWGWGLVLMSHCWWLVRETWDCWMTIPGASRRPGYKPLKCYPTCLTISSWCSRVISVFPMHFSQWKAFHTFFLPFHSVSRFSLNSNILHAMWKKARETGAGDIILF